MPHLHKALNVAASKSQPLNSKAKNSNFISGKLHGIMGTIIINRTSEYLNRLRNYSVYIDGEMVGRISNRETKEFDVSAGQHSIFAKIDWCSSPTLLVELKDHETKSLKVGGFKNGNWLMPTAFSLIALSFIAIRLFDFGYLFYLVIPIFLLMVYYITFGRKKYLTLTETYAEPQKAIALNE